MYNLLIVDDEKHYTDSLADTIPWEKIGIHNVYKAYSASQALVLIEEVKIDILMTDIRMPKMSGLELIAEIRQIKPGIKSLLLTGHADFEAAQKAVTLQAVDYLLKPVKDEKLLDTVQKIVHQLDEQQMLGKKVENALFLLRENSEQLKANLLLQVLNGSIGRDALEENMNRYEIPIRFGEKAHLFLIGLGSFLQSHDLYSQSLLRFAVTNILGELIQEKANLWSAQDEENTIVALIYSPSGQSIDPFWLTERMDQLHKEVKTYLKGQVVIVSAGDGSLPEEIRRCYTSGKSVISKCLVTMEPEAHRSGKEAELVRKLYESPLLTHLLESEQWEQSEAKIRSLVSLLHSTGSPERLRDVFFFFSNAFLYLAYKNNTPLEEIIDSETVKYFKGKPILHIAQLEQWALDVLASLQSRFSKASSNYNELVVKKIQQYIQPNLDKDLSLVTLAQMVYMHPNHLSKQFKLFTDLTVSQYIYHQRMQLAAEMLKHGECRIYHIGTQIGYPNTNWFIKKFKDYYNLTPQEYRDRFRL
ncbi:MAG: response regulator [Gorillibacterium sp.]|nr:response regulator [Gorillibacterium sp.]